MTKPGQPRRRLARPIVIGGAAVIAVLFLVITFIPLGGSGGGGGLQIQAAKIKAVNNTSTAKSESAGRYDRLELRRIAILNLSEHSIMDQAARAVRDRLLALPLVKEVVILSEAEAKRGEAAARRHFDLWFVLDLPRHEESGMALTGPALDAVVTVQGGTRPWWARHHYNDYLRPPLVNIEFNATLEHDSTTTGYESADARGQLAAKSIAGALADKLAEVLTGIMAEHAQPGALAPALPAAVYGSADEAAARMELPLPDSPELWQVYGGPGLLTHDEAMWTMPSKVPMAVLKPVYERLLSEGWTKRDGLKEDAAGNAHFRVARGPDVVEGYEAQRNTSGSKLQSRRVVFLLHRQFSGAEAEAAVEQLLLSEAPHALVATFQGVMSASQRSRFMQRIAEERATDPALLIQLLTSAF